MVHLSSQHLAQLLLLLLAGYSNQQAQAHLYRWRRGHSRSFHDPYWPAAFLHDRDTDINHGVFRPFFTGRSRPGRGGRFGGGGFNTASPIVDIFQDVVGDIKRVARELVDQPNGSPRVPAHELVESSASVTLYVDLPGCKKQDVDAQISEDSGTKTLRITALRKKPRGDASSGTSSGPTLAEESGKQSGGQSSEQSDEQSQADESPSSASSDSKEEVFELSFQIGEGIDVSGIRGAMEDGVLKLVMPKVAPEPPAKPIDIPIDPPSPPSPEQARKGSTDEDGAGSADDAGNTHISLS